jgi:molecular chaperone GrpE
MSRDKRQPHEETRSASGPNAEAAHTPGVAAGATAPDKIKALERALQETKEQYLRTLAETDNTRKRLHREREEFAKYAAETLVRGLLPIADSLSQAVVAVDKQADAQAVVQGVHLIYRQLLGLLEKEGVKRIPTVGEPFDPHQHEAVAQVDVGDGTPDDTVVEEIQVGYMMHGKVIRPAIVKVAKSATDQKSEVRGQRSEGQTSEARDQKAEQGHE